MSDQMYECPKCDSAHIALPAEIDGYPRSAKEAWGECLDCGSLLHWQGVDEPDRKLKAFESAETPVNALAGCTEKDLGEISVALGLLMEHPETVGYVGKLRDDLQKAFLTSSRRRAQEADVVLTVGE